MMAWEQLQELKEADPGGYEDIRFKAVENLAHAFPPGEPKDGLKFVSSKKRNTFPKKLVWEYIAYPQPMPDAEDKVKRLQKHWFYWLHCALPADTMHVEAVRKGNEFDLDVTIAFPDDFTIYLNPEMIDVKEDVVVRVGGEEVYRGKPQPDFVTILESLDARRVKPGAEPTNIGEARAPRLGAEPRCPHRSFADLLQRSFTRRAAKATRVLSRAHLG